MEHTIYKLVKSAKIISAKSPTWVRALQIGIGAIAIGLSLSSIIFPVLAVVATITAAAVILLLFGIEQIVAGIFLYKRSRFAHIGLGILVIILSSIVMAYPLASAVFVVLLAAFGLLFSGVSSIIAGLSGGGKDKESTRNTASSTGSRVLSVAAGALAIALSVMIMASPLFGVALAALVIGIALFVYGIRLVVTGISGRAEAVTYAAS
jgi:hypothetical protein